MPGSSNVPETRKQWIDPGATQMGFSDCRNASAATLWHTPRHLDRLFGPVCSLVLFAGLGLVSKPFFNPGPATSAGPIFGGWNRLTSSGSSALGSTRSIIASIRRRQGFCLRRASAGQVGGTRTRSYKIRRSSTAATGGASGDRVREPSNRAHLPIDGSAVARST